MPPVSSDLATFRDAIVADLRGNILPFWIRHVADGEHGTFHGSLTDELVVDAGVERGALLTTRILWTYSAAWRQFGEPAHLEMARLAYEDLVARFVDREHGGLYWSINADGTPRATRKQVYGQAFGIYALTEYHRASGSPEALGLATAIFRLIEKHARDRDGGGYLEAYARDWSPIEDMRLSAVDLNEPKSQNTLLHIMEAYTNLLRVWPDPALREALATLVGTMLTRVIDARTHHLHLFFALDWTPRSDRISYGHDIEASWLLVEAAEVLDDADLSARVRAAALAIADATLAEGLDPQDGAVFNEGGPEGISNSDKEWWPQAEAVVGFLNAWQMSGDSRYLDAAGRLWDFVDRHLIDHEHGEWLRGVTRDGRRLDDALKVSFWKCPYHNGRMGLEVLRRLTLPAAVS